MISIRHFRSAVERAGNRNVSFNLTRDKSDLRDTGGGIIRWVRNLNTSRNRETSRLFINTLKDSYGDQVTDQVVSRLQLDARVLRGKPLHSRNVREALNLAEEIKNQFVSSNRNIASNYHRPLASGFDMNLLQLKSRHIARQLFGKDTTTAEAVQARLDLDEIDQNIQKEIYSAGRDGKVFVTSEAADKIAGAALQKAMVMAYRESLMEQLDVTKAGSLSQQELSQINPDPETGLTIDLSDPDNEVVYAINQQLYSEMDEIFQNLVRIKKQDAGTAEEAGKEDLTIAVTPERLKDMAAKAVNNCVGERFEAAREALKLPIADQQTKERVVHQVLHSSIPVSMVSELEQAHEKIAGHLSVLGQYQQPSLQHEIQSDLQSGSVYETAEAASSSKQPQLETALQGMHSTVMDVMSRQKLSSDNRDRIMHAFWEVLLTGYGHDNSQLKGIALQMNQKESPLRDFSENVHYMRHFLPQSDLFLSDAETYQPLVGKASEYDFMLSNLATFLQESTGITVEPAGAIMSSDEISDNGILMLRNAGIQLPAPNRLNGNGTDVRFSNTAMEAIQADIDDQVRGGGRGGRISDDGVAREFVRDLGRATYRLQGEDVGRDPQQIIQRLRQFCTDESGQLDEQMLLNISRLAYQSTFGMVMSTMGQGREHLSPFQYMPSNLSDTRLEYSIAKDEQGNVVIDMGSSSAVGTLRGMGDEDAGGMPFDMPLDEQNSHLRMNIAVSLDARTHQPKLDTASVDYAFPSAPG